MADAGLPPPTGNRHAIVTDNDHGPIVSIAAWFLMVSMILSVLLRLMIRFEAAGVPGKDDAVAFAAMLCGIGGAISISLAVNHGLGTRVGLLTKAEILDVEMYSYSSTILFILTLSLAKISSLIFVARLTLTKTHLMVIRSVGVLVSLWTIAAVFAIAFQCQLPTPWDYLNGKCFSPVAFWDIIETVDILTDALLIAVPVWLVWTLQMSKAKKAVVISAFATRILVIVAAICRLVYLRLLEKSSDPTFVDAVTYNVCTQTQQALAVIVSCAPTLKPFMDRVESGMMNVSFHSRTGATYGQASYEMKNMSKTSGKGASVGSQNGNSSRGYRPDMVGYNSVVSASTKWMPNSKKDRPPASVQSNDSEQMIIRQTTDWNIRYDNERNSQKSPV